MDYKNITQNDDVIKLLIERDVIENKIFKLDNQALINYELEKLQIPVTNLSICCATCGHNYKGNCENSTGCDFKYNNWISKTNKN